MFYKRLAKKSGSPKVEINFFAALPGSGIIVIGVIGHPCP